MQDNTMAEDDHTIHGTRPHGQKKGGWFRNFFRLGEVGGYFFRGKDPSRPTNVNIKMMHGINKISIIIFLLGVLFIILKRLL